jgi:UDP-N-acetylmuramoyl-L-alanyl-D-glutamate--2,6-diaminopimelate ligase
LDQFIKGNKIAYGLDKGAEVKATDILYSPRGMQFVAKHSKFRVSINTGLLGRFNISNCLAALCATVIGLGLDPEIAARGVASLPGIPGRMENIDMGQDFTAIVDFAHTPNALKVTLETARELLTTETTKITEKITQDSMGSARLGTASRAGVRSVVKTPHIIAIFGSAGLRDKEKRRMMAETSAELADLTILTAEDPRTESLDEILEEMAAGAMSRGGREGITFWRIPDRGEAIKFALKLASPGDIVLACGKGHEQSMCFGKTEYPWDDRTAMRAALAELLGVDGPQIPYLPTQDELEKDGKS